MTFSALLVNLRAQKGWQALYQRLVLKLDEDCSFELRHQAGRVIALTYRVGNEVVGVWAVEQLSNAHAQELEDLKEVALSRSADLHVPSDLKEKLSCT